jgi:hypothetical protein
MREMALNVIEFVEHPDLLNDRSLSEWQRTILKSIYGLALNDKELLIYQEGTGRDIYLEREQEEASIIGGRRGGKTKIGCIIAIYEAFRGHNLPRGEMGFVILLARTMSQARVAFRVIRHLIHSSPILRKLVVRETRNEIELNNGVVICCYPCSYSSVRGVTVVAAICDEMAFWYHDENAANPEQEVLDALRPGMATATRSKLIKVSTPFKKEGILWNEFQRRGELDYLVWQAPTVNMNPTISSTVLERAQARDDRKFRREFMAEFSEDLSSWIDSEILDGCVVRNRKDLPRVPHVNYLAAIDPGFVHSDFAFVIAHLSAGNVIIDRLVGWRGTKKAPVAFEWACEQIASILHEFGINSVFGDQYCAPVIRQELMKRSIYFEQLNFDSNTRPQIFGNLHHLLVQSKIEIPDDPELLRQFRSLDEIKTSRGRIDIRASGNSRDDLAVVVALAAYQLIERPAPNPGVTLGLSRSTALNVIPERCPYQAICANFPRCLDMGYCQTFKDERVTP